MGSHRKRFFFSIVIFYVIAGDGKEPNVERTFFRPIGGQLFVNLQKNIRCQIFRHLSIAHAIQDKLKDAVEVTIVNCVEVQSVVE